MWSKIMNIGIDELYTRVRIAVARARNGRSTNHFVLLLTQDFSRKFIVGLMGNCGSESSTIHVSIDMGEKGSFPALLSENLRKLIESLSGINGNTSRLNRSLEAISGFEKSQKGRFPDIHANGIPVPVLGLGDSGDLELDLSDLFECVGHSVAASGCVLILTITDLHLVGHSELSALVAALHRISQLHLPILIIGTSPSGLHRRIGLSKPYAERMFSFYDVKIPII